MNVYALTDFQETSNSDLILSIWNLLNKTILRANPMKAVFL